MKIHNFTRNTFQSMFVAGRPFVAHGCDSFETFKAVRPGQFIEHPEGFEPCHNGFRYYRTDAGEVIGLSLG
ncbi:MAG: hypothetical protein FHK80_07225 [Azoarcus sp. PHD]|nr:MAG: hypothetical protein FHK80_07225 [Azoarcus sp. PHD]